MSAFGKTLMVMLIAGSAGSAGLWAGHQGFGAADASGLLRATVAPLLGMDAVAMASSGTAKKDGTAPTGAVIYYRHPDGDPEFSAVPMTTPDGRAYLAVLASEDVSFDRAAPAFAADTDAEAMAGVVATGEKRILYYRNPMGLPDTSATPKNDSMGMAYIPVYDGAESDGSTVTVSAGRIQRSGVKTTLATLSSISRPVVVPGSVMLDERRVSVVSIRAGAFIETVADVTTGAALQAGAPLVRVYSPDIAAAGALYASDLRQGGKARAAGSLQRLLNLGVPAELVAEIEETGKAPVAFTLTAPRGGVVLERMAVEGMMAEAGDPLFRIADASVVWVLADVPEYELASVRKGAAARVRFRSLPGREFVGIINEIYPEIIAQTRTARVRIELPNPEGLMLANMYADVEIVAGGTDPVVTVPDSAVIDSGERQVVIVDLGEGRFEPRAVQVGMRGDGMVEISEGVAVGDRVVVSANFLIDAESNLNAALSALVPPVSGTATLP